MSARDDILARVRAATQDIQEKDPAKDVPITWAYNQPTPLDDVLETFVENILDYKAKIVRTPANGTGDAIVAALRELGAQTVVVPDGAPASWVAAVTAGGLEVIRDQQLSHQQLNSIDAVLTGSRVSMAETGTICLDHAEDQGRRALTLVPDRHVCVVTADSVVSDVRRLYTVSNHQCRQAGPSHGSVAVPPPATSSSRAWKGFMGPGSCS